MTQDGIEPSTKLNGVLNYILLYNKTFVNRQKTMLMKVKVLVCHEISEVPSSSSVQVRNLDSMYISPFLI